MACSAVFSMQRVAVLSLDVLRAVLALAARVSLVTVVVGFMAAGPARAQCAGDCDGNGRVTINELIGSVRIALGNAALQSCGSVDLNGNGRVAVNELIAAVSNALNGCGFAGIYTATVALDGGESAEIEVRAASNQQISAALSITGDASSAVAQLAQAGSGTLTGQFDPVNGSFLVSGSIPGPGGDIQIRFGGTLGGSFTLEINGRSYGGSFNAAPTATPEPTPQGTVHVIVVGQSGLPFDPEVLVIDPGDTVEWMWVAGPHSVRSSAVVSGQPSCSPDGLFDSGPRSSGVFRHTFDTPGMYGFHCGVVGHCDAFESGYIEVRGPATATPSRTLTPSPTFAIPTSTATPDTVGGVSTRMLGFFSGTATFGTFSQPARFQILVDSFGPLVNDLSQFPSVSPNPVRMSVVSPTELSYSDAGPPIVSFTLSLDASSHVVGRYEVTDPLMPRLPADFDLVREE